MGVGACRHALQPIGRVFGDGSVKALGVGMCSGEGRRRKGRSASIKLVGGVFGRREG